MGYPNQRLRIASLLTGGAVLLLVVGGLRYWQETSELKNRQNHKKNTPFSSSEGPTLPWRYPLISRDNQQITQAFESGKVLLVLVGWSTDSRTCATYESDALREFISTSPNVLLVSSVLHPESFGLPYSDEQEPFKTAWELELKNYFSNKGSFPSNDSFIIMKKGKSPVNVSYTQPKPLLVSVRKMIK